MAFTRKDSILAGFVCVVSEIAFLEFSQFAIPWKNYVGVFVEDPEFTKLAFKRDLLFGPVDNRFRQRYKAVVFDLFHKLPVRELSFGQKRCAEFLDVQGYGLFLDRILVI